MGIKIKYTDPSINEFATDDIIINVISGSLFFKSNTNLYKLQGDNLNTPTTESGGDMWVRSGSNLYYTDGKVGIGNTSPNADLHVGSGGLGHVSRTRLILQPPYHTGGPWKFNTSDTSTTASLNLYYGATHQMTFIHNGSIGIGTTTPTYKLEVNGIIKANGALVISDKRLKRDILPIENALDKILALNGISYNWNKEFDLSKNLDDHNHLGLIAQDVEKILSQVVSTESEGLQIKSVSYSDIIPVLIEAIKEQQNQINELKNQLKDIPYG